MKTFAMSSEIDWPPGQYCVFRASDKPCPAGLHEGWIFWDDEDINNNEVCGVIMEFVVF